HQDVAERPLRARRIGERGAAAEPAGRPHERAVKRLHVRAAMGEGFRAELLDGLSDLEDGGRRGERLADRYGHGVRHAAGPLPAEAAAFEAEDAAPDAIELNRDDRRPFRSVAKDAFHAGPEREHHPGPADLPFREDADDVPFP